MSLRSLVKFAHEEISDQPHERREDLTHFPEDQQQLDERLSPEDSDLMAQPPPVPDWILNPESEIVSIDGASPRVFTEGPFDNPIAPTGNPAPGPDTLAYYLPYHFYCDGIWGIYLKATGILELAAELKVAPITHGDDDAIQPALISLFEHELFHCLTEQAATRAEVVVRTSVYHCYFFDRYARFHEEAVANASAHHKISKTYPACVAQLEAWMKSQGRGYQDFTRYAGRFLGKGRLKCSNHIIRFVPPRTSLPSRLPSEFLFRKSGAANVPTYLVLDAKIAGHLLRPFPKHGGVLVKVHSREHPPPHIHVEMPPGNEVTRCEWPSLEPVKGDPQLSHKDQGRLRGYLQKFGGEICEKLRSVYQNPHLPMPSL